MTLDRVPAIACPIASVSNTAICAAKHVKNQKTDGEHQMPFPLDIRFTSTVEYSVPPLSITIDQDISFDQTSDHFWCDYESFD